MKNEACFENSKGEWYVSLQTIVDYTKALTKPKDKMAIRIRHHSLMPYSRLRADG